MTGLLELRDSLTLPFILVMAAGGLYLTVYMRFFQFKYLLLGGKILTGALDWKGSRGKITPVDAFCAGSGATVLPGAIIGSAAAFAIAGPGVLPWIWIFAFLSMPLQYAASTLSLRFRAVTQSGSMLAGPALIIEKGLKARWLALVFSFLFIAASFFSGAGFTVFALHETIAAAGPSIPAITISLIGGVLLTLISLGGIRRIGWVSRYLFMAGLFLTLLSIVVLFYNIYIYSGRLTLQSGFFPAVWGSLGTAEYFSRANLMKYALATSVFLALTETGSGKASAIAGLVRTDFPAKQGLSALVPPFLEGPVVSSVIFFLAMRLEELFPGSSSQSSFFLTRIFTISPALPYLIIPAAASLFLTSMNSWMFSGYQTAHFIGGRKSGAAFQISFLIVLFAAGYLLHGDHSRFAEIVFLGTICSGMFVALFAVAALLLQAKTARTELRKYLDTGRVRYEISKDFYLLLMTALPKNLLSRLFGFLSMLRLPRFMMVPILQAFARVYQINLDEAELNLKDYPSLNKFFTRALREGARVVDAGERTIVSPVDGTVSQFGEITDGRMIQAKGIFYTMEDLLDCPEFAPEFVDGSYIVIYLSPQDYHRIHSPFMGNVKGYSYSPGKLFMVNQIAVNGLHGLFPKNERLTTYLETKNGMIAVVKVGATNVGKISVTYDTIQTNRWIRRSKTHRYDRQILMDRGQELGRFEMGSTVILLFQKNAMRFLPKIEEKFKVKFGQAIGEFTGKK